MPQYLNVDIGSRVRVHLNSLSVLSHVKSLSTFPNPKFRDMERLGLYTGNTPREIPTWSFDSEDPLHPTISIPRGLFSKLSDSLKPHDIQVVPKACTAIGKPLSSIAYVNDEFALDERQERAVKAMLEWNQGIIHAATSAGKSAIILSAIASIKRKTMVVVHRKILLEQLMSDAKRWIKNATIGQIGAGKCEVGDVTFCIDKSLNSAIIKTNGKILEDVGCVIQDECHISPSSIFQNIIDSFPAHKRFGLTGTLKRKDRMEFLMFSTFGNVIATITKSELEQAGRTTPVDVVCHSTKTTVPEEVFDLSTNERWRAIDKIVHSDQERKKFVLSVVKDILSKNSRARILILFRFVEPCNDFSYLLSGEGIRAGIVTGKEQGHKDTCDALERGDLSVISATIGTVSTGVNIKTLTDIVLFSPVFSNELILVQARGRLMRRSNEKERATFHLIFDPAIFEESKIRRAMSILLNS